MTTKPDFDVLLNVLQSSRNEVGKMLLKQLWEQAYHLGLNQGWVDQQEANPQGELE